MASSFQNQECGQDGWIFLRVYGPRRRNLVNKGFIIRLLVKFCLRDTAGSPERVRWLHLARSSSQSQRAIWFILPARGAGQIIIMVIIISVRAVFLTIESLSMTFTANGKRQRLPLSLTIHSKYKYFDSTVQRAEDRQQKLHFCRLQFAVKVMLNLSIMTSVTPILNEELEQGKLIAALNSRK